MAITGAPSFGGGGSFSAGGPEKGQYHCIVADATTGESKNGRPKLTLVFNVHNDPNHPAKQGKKLTTMFQYATMDTDEKDKADVMKGMLKRLVYDPFGLPWGAEFKPLDTRKLVGKEVWVLIGDNKQADGTLRNGVVALSATQEGLPLPKAAVIASTTNAKGPTVSRSRRA